MKTLFACLILTAAAWGQDLESTGNRLLNGVYNFRQLHLETGSAANTYSRRIAIWGQISFNGNGSYTINDAKVLDTNVSGIQTLTLSGKYVLSSSGLGYLDNPSTANSFTFGLVSQGIFIGSSTESGTNDLFVAAPVSTTTTSNFSGQYWLTEFASPESNAYRTRDTYFQMNPNGSGALGTISARGYAGLTGNPATQTFAGATYSFGAGGVGTITYPAISLLGSRTFYTTPDRKFAFGGSENAFDFFVAVLATPTRPTQESLAGLYYSAGLEQNNNISANVLPYSYYGSYLIKDAKILGHQRLLRRTDKLAYDFTYADDLIVNSDGSFDDFTGEHYLTGADGNIRISVGTGLLIGITVSTKAQVLSSPGVFVNPIGVLNSASYSPFTSGISPGELIRLYGSGLSSTSLTDSRFPTTLGGVRVSINGQPAPIYLVSPAEVDVQVPWSTRGSVISIQVTNGTASNVVTTFLSRTTPGVFSQTQDGVGFAAALHANGAPVTPANPASIGEVIALYLTGLGAVTPAVADGAPGPGAEPLARAADIVAKVDGIESPVAYAGLAPGFIGLYQLNITIPRGVASAQPYLNIESPDSINSQIQIPVRLAAGASSLRSASRGSSPDRRGAPALASPRLPLNRPTATPDGWKFPGETQ